MSDHWDNYYDDTTSAIGLPEQRTIPPMPPVKSSDNKVCGGCIKNDVCNIKDELTKAMCDIQDIQDRTNVFIDVIVQCKKFAKCSTYTGIR